MAGHAAGLRVPRRRVETIQALAAEIAAQQHLAAHLMTITFRAFYHFFTIACLTVGIVTFANGRTDVATVWGGVGITLAALWISTKVVSRVLRRAFMALRAELAKGRSDQADESHDDQV